jgi:hypothetical protein
MEHAKLLKIIAPCGLSCAACLSMRDGEIETLSRKLRQRLGGFARFAERFMAMDPAFADYPAFERMLDFFSQAKCDGCRVGGCLHTDCPVHLCVKEKHVDYCHQCQDFPCGKLDDKPWLKVKWEKNNLRLREIGIEAYHLEIKDLPRYG